MAEDSERDGAVTAPEEPDRYIVIAPYVTAKTMTTDGWRVVGLYQGAPVPPDIPAGDRDHLLSQGLIARVGAEPVATPGASSAADRKRYADSLVASEEQQLREVQQRLENARAAQKAAAQDAERAGTAEESEFERDVREARNRVAAAPDEGSPGLPVSGMPPGSVGGPPAAGEVAMTGGDPDSPAPVGPQGSTGPAENAATGAAPPVPGGSSSGASGSGAAGGGTSGSRGKGTRAGGPGSGK